ncbi:outer membrane protein [Martelella alba]|uniref:outer membrane protein n=1 Tax=Martelella alba TaxID=2590451 RepID=UPI0015E85A9A|nr:outer membrane beta-barrel protein [Martelella alba]
MKTSLVLALLCSGLALPAFAADITAVPYDNSAAMAAPATMDWTGFYLGAGGGYSWLHASSTLPGGGSVSDDFNGGMASVFAGYDYQFDNKLVVGIEGDVIRQWNEKTYAVPYVGTEKIGAEWGGSVRGRLGYALGNALLYSTGGLAIQSVHDQIGSDDSTSTVYGYTFGAGVDYAFTSRLFGRIEYRYTGFPTASISGGLLAGYGKADLDVHSNTVTAAIGLHF